MSDLVSIASSAVSAYQRALGTVSNNIANVGSVGYSKQEVNLVENAPRSYGTTFLGTGVNVTGVRRLYDEFVENSLRNATSELGTQGPMVDYAGRVVNILGSEDVGLLSAFDEFFDAARQLSTDSSSLIMRSQFLSKAEALAGRFGELNAQLNLVDQETQGLIQTQVSKLNQLSEQLALVNQQLRKTKYLDRQPPALLDQRDQLLREMSEVAKIQVKEELNGEVVVALGSTITRGQIVNINGAYKLGAIFGEGAVDKVDLVIEPYSKNPEVVPSLAGGSLSGMLQFRRQLLAPTFASLDNLAKTMVSAVNTIHKEGVDLQGQNGQDLFKYVPQFNLQALNGQTQVRLGPELLDFNAFQNNPLQLSYAANVGQVNNLSLSGSYRTGDQITVTFNGVAKSFTLIGPRTDASGRPVLGDPVEIESVRSQLISFLEGGNANSVDGAFGRQISVRAGAAQDILVTSDVFGAFTFDIASTSLDGKLDNTTQTGRWTVTDMVSGQSASGVGVVDINGLRLNFSGQPADGETLILRADNRPAAGIRLAIDDPNKVAAAGRFRVIENQFNPSGVSASLRESLVRYAEDEAIWLPQVVGSNGTSVLDNNILESEAIRIDRVSVSPIAVIPEGYKNVALYLGELNGQVLDLQVFTRDGRHIVGRQMADDLIAVEEAALGRPLRDDERAALITQAGENFMSTARLAGVSFAEGAGYSSQYLNAQGVDSYRDMELFYGVKAMVQEIQKLNDDHVVGSIDRLAASVTSGLVQPFQVAMGETIFSADDFVLNGVSLASLKLEQVGNNARLVVEGTDPMGRPVRTVLSDAVEQVPGTNGLYRIDPVHMQSWLRAQPGWGVGERQTISFEFNPNGGNIDIALTDDFTVRVPNVPAGSSALETAQRVAQAIEASAYIQDFSGRSVQVLDTGAVVVQFALTDQSAPLIRLDTGVSGMTARVSKEPATPGRLGLGEMQRYRFSKPLEDGAFFFGGTRVEVKATDTDADVSRKVAAFLGGQQRLVSFSGTPIVPGNTVAPITVAGYADGSATPIPNPPLGVPIAHPATKQTIAQAVKTAIEASPAFMTTNAIEAVVLEGDGQLRFVHSIQTLVPNRLEFNFQTVTGVTTAQEKPTRFVDGFDGRRVALDDGELVVRYLASEGDVANLGITPATDVRAEVQTLSFVNPTFLADPNAVGANPSFSVTGASANSFISIDNKVVDLRDGDTPSLVATKTLAALNSQQQTIQFSGSAAAGQTFTVKLGALSIPITLGAAPATHDATALAEATRAALSAAPNLAANPPVGLFQQAYPESAVFVDAQGALRVAFDRFSVAATPDIPSFVVEAGASVGISATTTVQQPFTETHPGSVLSLTPDGTGITVRYPVSAGDVTNISIPSTDVQGVSVALITQQFKRPDPGILANVQTENFRGLSINLLPAYDAKGNPLTVNVNYDADGNLLPANAEPRGLPLQQLRFTQTPLGQGEEQKLFFGPATATGDIEIAGLKIRVENGETGAQIAARVKQALEKEFGSSELGGSLRQYILNAEGGLTVRAAVSSGNVRNLELTTSGGTGVSFRSETTSFIEAGEPFESEVRLGFGRTGDSTDLAKLGFRTGVYLSGIVKEDLLVFATGQDSGLGFKLGATYTEGSRDPVETLRAEPFDVVFTSATQFQIVDRTTGTVVAQRAYDPQLGIQYRGVTLNLNGQPAAGDRFAIDGNQDGIGNNANMLRVAALQNERLVGGVNGRTLADAYSQSVSDVGNMAFQSSIAQKALEVVKDQAVQARDKVSGVSLDEEAADLIRFQQAYQASAKVMQTASTLFDAIIGIR